MADIRYNHCIKLIKLTFFVAFTKNGIFKLTKCGLSPERFLYSTQCIKTRIEWLKRITAAAIRTCIFGDAATFIEKRLQSFIWRYFYCAFLGSSLGMDSNVQPGVGKFGCN